MNSKVTLRALDGHQIVFESEDDGSIAIRVGNDRACVNPWELDDAIRRVMPSPFEVIGGPLLPRGVHPPIDRFGFQRPLRTSRMKKCSRRCSKRASANGST